MYVGLSYAVILPLYGLSFSNTTLQLVGAGFTTPGSDIRMFAPRPCGTPYATPLTELNGCIFRSGKMSA